MDGVRSDRVLLFVLAVLLVAALTLLISFDMLPAAPAAPTPTFPKGIDLPDRLPRIPR